MNNTNRVGPTKAAVPHFCSTRNLENNDILTLYDLIRTILDQYASGDTPAREECTFFRALRCLCPNAELFL